MSEKTSDGWAIPWPTIIAVLIAGGGAYVFYPPLLSERPSFPGGMSTVTSGSLDVEARPWQDPFKAVEDHLAHIEPKQSEIVVSLQSMPLFSVRTLQPNRLQEEESHTLKNLRHEIRVADQFIPPASDLVRPTLLVLPVMLSSSRQGEAAEQRLRTRQAVLEGLAVAGFVSKDAEHIGYVNVPWNAREVDSHVETIQQMADAATPGAAGSGALAVPYEWCRPTFAPIAFSSLFGPSGLSAAAQASTEPSTQPSVPQIPVRLKPVQVLVLWLPEEAFSNRPLTRIAYLLDQLKLPAENVQVGLIGPRHWDTLESMAKDAVKGAIDGTDFSVSHALAETTMYIATTTAEDEFLIHNFRTTFPTLEALWDSGLKYEGGPGSQGGMKVVRTVIPDDEVAKALVDELQLRNVKVAPGPDAPSTLDNIAVILECDTKYGRGLYYSMAAAISGHPVAELLKNAATTYTPNVYYYTYLRGVDGKLLPAGGRDASSGTPPSGSTSLDGDGGNAGANNAARGRQGNPSANPPPDGYNQTDYLERMADQLQEKDRELKRRGGAGLKAVGVLGSDLYDKLLILKALRTRLPSAIFFTTTADARYSLPADWRAAHNLVIGSSFGLTLHPFYQRAIPPFRDGSQTAVFVATLAAARVIEPNELRGLLGMPRIFEVGRGRLYDLSPDAEKPDLSEPRQDNPPPKPSTIHPPRPDLGGWWTPRRSNWTIFGVGAAVSILLWLLHYVSRHRESGPNAAHKRGFLAPDRLIFIAMIPFSIAVVWAVYAWQREGGEGEPFAMFGGVSVWPSETLRLLAALWSVTLLFRAHLDTIENDAAIQKQFHLKRTKARSPWKVRWGGLHRNGRWNVVVKVPVANNPAPFALGTSNPREMVDAQRLWNAYVMDGTSRSRACRAFAATIVYYVLILAIMQILGFPTAPCRGDICRRADWFITYWMAVPASILLTFFVIDSTLTNRRFIRYITMKPTDWCKEAYEQCGQRGLTDDEDLRQLLDVRLIALRTMVVGEFIYFPFVILFLLLLSRASCFDDWDWPPGVVIVYLASTLVSVVSVLLLRHAAEKARRESAEGLRERAIYHTAVGNSGKAEAVKLCVAEIEAERRGAFSLLSQHPLLAAILLPSGGIGIWALLEYLATNVF